MAVNRDRDALQQWLIREIERNQAYHNHKEKMAWTATAFYIVGIITLGYWASKVSTPWMLIPLLLLGVLAGFFLGFQFHNRWIAAGRIEGLTRIFARVQSGWSPLPADWEERGELYPQFIEREIPQHRRLGEGRWQVEIVSYIAIALSTIIAICLLPKSPSSTGGSTVNLGESVFWPIPIGIGVTIAGVGLTLLWQGEALKKTQDPNQQNVGKKAFAFGIAWIIMGGISIILGLLIYCSTR